MPLSDFLDAARRSLASLPTVAAASRRMRVRKRCQAEGAPVPDWAKPREPATKPPAPTKPKRANRMVLKPKREATIAPAVRMLEIPPELSAWRARGYGRVVQISARRGVILHELGGEPRRFKSVDAAVAAVA